MKPVILPKTEFTQEAARLVRWVKNAGATVEEGEPIAEVETDKTTMEIEAPASGILAGLRFKEDDSIPVTEVMAYILGPGESVPESPKEPAIQPPLSAGLRTVKASMTPVVARSAAEHGIDESQIAGSGPGVRVTRQDVEASIARGGKLRASPAARRAAKEFGVPLGAVAGTGPGGRIRRGDVRVAPRPDEALPRPGDVIPLQGMRRTIATRMQRSAQEAPHIFLEADVDVSATEDLREKVNWRHEEPKITLTAMIARVVAWALLRHPMLNSRLEGEHIRLLSDINLGIAVALEEGLIVPVVHQTDRKTLAQLALDIAELSARAREGRLRPEDVSEGTFTISNLGMFGVDRFAAILNPPQCGILAIGKVRKRVVPDEADRPVVRPIVTLTLSADHRIVDGAVASRFLADVVEALESPGVLSA